MAECAGADATEAVHLADRITFYGVSVVHESMYNFISHRMKGMEGGEINNCLLLDGFRP